MEDSHGIEIRNIQATLANFERQLHEQRATVDEIRIWRAGTEEVIDSMQERINDGADAVDKVEGRVDNAERFMNRYDGGKTATAQLVGTIISACAAMAAVAKLFHLL